MLHPSEYREMFPCVDVLCSTQVTVVNETRISNFWFFIPSYSAGGLSERCRVGRNFLIASQLFALDDIDNAQVSIQFLFGFSHDELTMIYH